MSDTQTAEKEDQTDIDSQTDAVEDGDDTISDIHLNGKGDILYAA